MTETPHTIQQHPSTADANDPAQATLRLLASVQPPNGLEDRLHQRLAQAGIAKPQRSVWSFWAPMRRLQFAGVALVAITVAASTWSVYHGRTPYPSHSPAQTTPQAVLPVPDSVGGFKTAGAERRPSTVAPIRVPPAPRKKPSASHAVKRPQKPTTATGDAKAAVTPQN